MLDAVGGAGASSAVDQGGGARRIEQAVLGLHEAQFAGYDLRILLCLSGLAGAGLIASGLCLWVAKRQGDGRGPRDAMAVLRRVNLGVLLGLPLALAAYGIANRLLPVGTPDRAAWEAHILFLAWAAAIALACVVAPVRMRRGCLLATGVAFLALPILNGITTSHHVVAAASAGQWSLAAVDMGFLLIGLTFSAAFLRDRRRRSA